MLVNKSIFESIQDNSLSIAKHFTKCQEGEKLISIMLSHLEEIYYFELNSRKINRHNLHTIKGGNAKHFLRIVYKEMIENAGLTNSERRRVEKISQSRWPSKKRTLTKDYLEHEIAHSILTVNEHYREIYRLRKYFKIYSQRQILDRV